MNGPTAPQCTFDQLVVLCAIRDTGSFAAAAVATHRVPSAVSWAMRNLEESWGLTLFDRSRRSVVLTPDGRVLADRAAALLEEARQLDGAAARLAGGWEAQLTIVVDGALPLGPILDAIAVLSAPDVPTRVRLDVEYQEGVTDRLTGGTIALHLGFGPHDDTAPFDVTPLPDLPFVLVAASSHPLAAGPVTADDLAAGTDIVVRDSSPRYAANPKGSYAGAANVVYVGDFHTKRVVLLAGGGFGWMPLHLVDDDLGSGRLSRLQAQPHAFTYHPRLVVRRDAILGRAGRSFVASMAALGGSP